LPSVRAAFVKALGVAIGVALMLVALAGCGGKTNGGMPAVGRQSEDQVEEPLTPQQERVQEGARLVVSDGCSACHLAARDQAVGPSFASMASRPVTLSDGRRVRLDEARLREGLERPERLRIRGYDAGAMIAAVRRLDLRVHPADVAALAAFIEQVGPE
jgi:Cytochrome c